MTAGHGAPLDYIASIVRRERERRGLTSAELARRAGIAKSTLSQLESASGNPSVETLWALSVALETPFADFVSPPQPSVEVIRSGDGPTVRSDVADYAATLLSTSPNHARRDIYQIQVEPGAPRTSDPHSAGIVEHVIICAGRARVGPVDAAVELGPGDYVRYPGDIRHVMEALVTGTVAVLISEHN